MKYANAAALRAALDQRLVTEANSSRTDIARLRRRVIFERRLVRFALAGGDRWVLKGGPPGAGEPGGVPLRLSGRRPGGGPRATLARIELKAIFEVLIQRVSRFELAGPVIRSRSSFLNAIKELPLRVV